jgi:spermidine/putrescine transport system permease protein
MAERGFIVSRLPGFTTIALLVFAALYLPILVLVVFSFNGGDSLSQWGGFSFRWFAKAWENDQVKDATIRSLWLALVAALIATAVATAAALGTTRRKPFKGQTFIYVMINQPLMVPEIVTAVALLIFFAWFKVNLGLSGHGISGGGPCRISAFPLPICRSGRGWKAWT